MNMIAFDVFLNGNKLARAGVGFDGVFTAITTVVVFLKPTRAGEGLIET